MNINIKTRIENLLIKLPITNSASGIVERFHTNLLKEYNISPLNEAKYLNSLINQLKSSAWIPEVSDFITESEFVINENFNKIKALLICEELKNQKESDFYKRALLIMESVSNSNLELKDIEKLKDFVLIPCIKEFYTYMKESLAGKSSLNPNFLISNIITPISPISENKFKFYSMGKILELNTETSHLVEKFEKCEPQFEKLSECIKIFDINQSHFVTGIRNKVIDVNISEKLVKVNNEEIKNDALLNYINNTLGLSTLHEKKQISLIEALISNFDSFVTIDESVKITPIKESGVSYTIFNFGNKLYGQSVNPQMQENSINIFENSLELLKDIKNKINYDATDVLSNLVKSDIQVSEKTNILQRNLQIKIGKLQDKKNQFTKTAIENNVYSNSKIQEALKLIDSEIQILKESYEPLYEKVNVKITGTKFNVYEGSCHLSELINNVDVKVNIGKDTLLIDRTQLELF